MFCVSANIDPTKESDENHPEIINDERVGSGKVKFAFVFSALPAFVKVHFSRLRTARIECRCMNTEIAGVP